MKQIKAGDLVLVYVVKMKLAGIFRVTQGYFYDETRIRNESYDHRIRIAPLKVPKDLIDITSWYSTFFGPKTKKEPQGYFQRTIRELKEEDEYSMFESVIDSHLGANGIIEQEKTSSIPSQSLSYQNLHAFIMKKMNSTQANYQPAMIKILLESNGRATKDVVAGKIRELNPENHQQTTRIFRYFKYYKVIVLCTELGVIPAFWYGCTTAGHCLNALLLRRFS